ncbi:MAG: DUF2460 domain-containing protein [Pseudomonadota bacterium]
MDRPGFHNVMFPVAITVGARGGPGYATDVTQLASGGEVRQSRWSRSLRQWDVAGGVTDFAAAELLLSFFEARQGRRYAFRLRDPIDHSSALGGAAPSPTDQTLGTGDGVSTVFPLIKNYGQAPYTVTRAIALADPASLRMAVDGTELSPTDAVLSADGDAAVLTTPPQAGATITAGYLFDVPARFDRDDLEFLVGAQGASLPAVPLREVRL